MRCLIVLFCFVSLPCWAVPDPACSPWIATAEKTVGTAPGLLAAIGLVESGRQDPRTRQRTPWPWTVTAEGVGTFYPGKADAIRAVQALQARGVNSIDVGCMQVNLLQHPDAFRDLDQAFEPASNTSYAARFLSRLFSSLGSWTLAASAYHSMTPDIGASYGRLIAAVWSGAPISGVEEPGGIEVVRFPGGGQMRITHDATGASGRVLGYLSGP